MKKFYCKFCDKYYANENSLYCHNNRYHKPIPNTNINKQKRDNGDKLSLIKRNQITFNCQHCDKEFNRNDNMKRHMKTCKFKEKIESNDIEKEPCNINIEEHIKPNDLEKINCIINGINDTENEITQTNSPKINFLYIVHNNDNPLICKFGYTTNPLQRIRSIAHNYVNKGQFIALYKIEKEEQYIKSKLYKEPDNIIIKYKPFKNKLNNDKLYNELTYIKECQGHIMNGNGGSELFSINGIETIMEAIEKDFIKLGIKIVKTYTKTELLILNNDIYADNLSDAPQDIQELINIKKEKSKETYKKINKKKNKIKQTKENKEIIEPEIIKEEITQK